MCQIFVPSFIEIPQLNTEIVHHPKQMLTYNGRTDGQTDGRTDELPGNVMLYAPAIVGGSIKI